MSCMSVSILFILWFETDQAKLSACRYVSRCPKKYKNAKINEKPCFDLLLSVFARDDILLSDFHYANARFMCSL